MTLSHPHSRRALAPLLMLLAAVSFAPAPASARTPRRHPAAEARREARRAASEQTASETGTTTETTPQPASGSSGETTTEPVARQRRAGRCRLTLQASAALVTAGTSVDLSGTLMCAGSPGGEGITVTIYRRQPGGGGEITEVGTATTGAEGAFALTGAAVEANSIFLARSQAARGTRAVVKVSPRVTLSGPATAAVLSTRGSASTAARNRLTLTGTVTPAAAGTRVTLQREYAGTGERWMAIAFGQVGADGRYSFTHGFRAPGQVNIRVVVHPHGSAPAASEPLTYNVVQAQNPQLTIESSADPVTAGAPVTISGVAAGAAGQPVTLLARAPGHSFAAVAGSTTLAGGTYSFTITPVRGTFYRVADDTTVSDELFEEFKYPITAAVSSPTVAAGGELTFSGTLLLAPAGQVVRLEREQASGVGFDPVGSGVVAADGSFSITESFSRAGTYTMRLRAPATSDSQGSASEPIVITVTSPVAGSSEPQPPVSPPEA